MFLLSVLQTSHEVLLTLMPHNTAWSTWQSRVMVTTGSGIELPSKSLALSHLYATVGTWTDKSFNSFEKTGSHLENRAVGIFEYKVSDRG